MRLAKQMAQIHSQSTHSLVLISDQRERQIERARPWAGGCGELHLRCDATSGRQPRRRRDEVEMGQRGAMRIG